MATERRCWIPCATRVQTRRGGMWGLPAHAPQVSYKFADRGCKFSHSMIVGPSVVPRSAGGGHVATQGEITRALNEPTRVAGGDVALTFTEDVPCFLHGDFAFPQPPRPKGSFFPPVHHRGLFPQLVPRSDGQPFSITSSVCPSTIESSDTTSLRIFRDCLSTESFLTHQGQPT